MPKPVARFNTRYSSERELPSVVLVISITTLALTPVVADEYE